MTVKYKMLFFDAIIFDGTGTLVYKYIYYNKDRSVFIYIFTRLPVTRWVKLSLNFELLVPK